MRNPFRTIVASAARVTFTDKQTIGKLNEPWQHRAFGYYDRIGEIHYASQFYAKGLSRVRFFPALPTEEGDKKEITDGPVLDIFNRMQDPGGGRSEMQSEYGRLKFLVGECYLIITNPNEDDEKWEIVSKEELRVNQDNTYSRFLAPGLSAETLHDVEDLLSKGKAIPDKVFTPLGKGVLVYRFWTKHPRYSALADSPMRGVLDVCEELVALTDAVRARVRSRLAAAGILLLNDKIDPPPLEVVGDENARNDPFLDKLFQAATAAIVNPGSASAVVPIVVRVPGELLEGNSKPLEHVQIHDPKDTYPETGLRNEAIRRLALGLDMPPEELLGVADSNHWSGWLVDEKSWKAHLFPIAQDFASDLLSVYLRPACKEAGVKNWDQITIEIDEADVVNHPDRAADARELHDRLAISDEALREAAGFGAVDEMTPEELQRWIGIKTHDSSLAMFGIPSVRQAPSGSEPPAPESGAAPENKTGGDVAPGPPPDGPPTAAKTLAVLLQGSAETAVERCREIAGAKIRARTERCKGKTKACEECALSIDGVVNGKVATVLGFDRVAGLNAPSPQVLVSGGADLFVSTACRLGCPAEFATVLGELIENHAAMTLYDDGHARLPAGFIGALQRGQLP